MHLEGPVNHENIFGSESSFEGEVDVVDGGVALEVVGDFGVGGVDVGVRKTKEDEEKHACFHE